MSQLLGSILDQVRLTTIVDIGITALLIYWLFSLIRGTRAVRLVIGVSVLVVVYALAIAFDLRLLTQILQAGAVVGLFALVVVFQPELRRALERIGRVGSFGWLLSPAESRAAVHVSTEVARAAAGLSADGHGALIVLERETGLEEVAETGVMIHGDVSADLLRTIFMPRAALHDGAVIIREDRIVAAGALLPLAETSIHTERFGTRHRAALGITEQTDAVVVVVSEENGQISLVERARIVRNLTEGGLARAIQGLLDPAGGRRTAWTWRDRESGMGGRSPRIRELGRFVGRSPAAVAATPAAVPNAGPGATTVATTRNAETTSASAAIGQAVNVANPRSADGKKDGAENGMNPGVPMSDRPATDDRAAVVVDPPNRLDPEAGNSVAADPADVVTDEPASATTTPTARPTATPARKPEGDPIATAAVRAQR
jgi:diadenylate cyclase